MVLEWIDAAQAFANLGMAGVAAWLLTERFVLSRQRDRLFQSVIDTVNTNSVALREHAVATQRLATMLENESRLMSEFRTHVTESLHRNMRR
jgi:hypothetical protein